jgi:hypothetical protein
MAARRTARKDSKPRSTRRPRRRETKLAFEALAIEGGLLSPDWLARVAALDAGGQSEADYRVPKGLQLRDEISRYWRIAQAYWSELAAGRANVATPEVALALSERFVLAFLRESFGFASLTATEPLVIAERSYPLRFAALGGRVPVVIAPAGLGLDTLSPAFGDGGRRRSAFGLAQESLNADEGATWGLATDGFTLRILRDNASLTRPAWIEADLARIFTEERYSDFAALWLLAHETRFGRADQPPLECALETWRDSGREEGTRAREHLRTGVEEALLVLGQGFLAHSENSALRSALQDGSLSTMAYFQELLRLVYRLIFLLTVEERGLLHPESSEAAARGLYAEGYSLRRLRERSVRRSAHDRFSDLWEAAKIVFRGLAAGESRLALPALAGLFALMQCPTLDAAKLENHSLLLAMFRLSWLRESSRLTRVNWRDMGPEELGSVYESLLELVPQVTQGGRIFAFATGAETKGNARKTSGSYYTPDSLVQVLLESALEPVVANALAVNPERPVDALLDLSIVDPACGSGHFLLAAARRLASHVARFQANGTPSAAEYRHALRQVVGRCLYGVDLNPMAVELCKVSLWMEAVEPGLPLTFLDAHIRHGNALLGATPELMADGIPDAAWGPIEGDDRKVASGLKKRNKRSKGGQRALDTLWTEPTQSETAEVARAVAELEAVPDTDIEALACKKERWEDLLYSDAYRHQKLVADLWCAAFIWPKQPGPLQDVAPTDDVWIQIRDRRGQPNTLTIKTMEELVEQFQFFHWNLVFPQVFARGGFDLVLGNPPWDRLTFEEREWFAQYATAVAFASTASKRRGLVAGLEKTDPELYARFMAARRRVASMAEFCSASSRFPLTAVGHFNTYALFTELAASTLVRSTGRCALLSPTALLTGDYSKALTRALIDAGRLLAVFDFDNRGRFFPAMQPNMRFALLVLAGHANGSENSTLIASQLRHVSELSGDRIYRLEGQSVITINPETATIPFFYSARDAQIVAAIYHQHPSLFDASGQSSWSVDFGRMLNMSDDSGSFLTLEELPAQSSARAIVLPVYEAKLTAQYDHRAGTFENVPQEDRFRLHASTKEPSVEAKDDPSFVVFPRYWLHKDLVQAELAGHGYFLAYRDAISATADARCLEACFLPCTPSVHTLLVVWATSANDAVVFAAALNSFILDYVLRQKATGGHAARFIVRQLPFPQREEFSLPSSWYPHLSVNDWLIPRVLELTYTAWDLEPLAHEIGYNNPPFRWDPERRFRLRAELDAAFFHLYGLSRDDTGYILDTFPIVRKNDEKAHGEYRTKRVILEIYDAMAEATRTGRTYATRLDPPPADPRVAHPPDPARERTKESAT